MIKFFIYLIESTVCLTLFYLVYLLFFRKETYFRFNRIYLNIALLLSVTIPLLNMNLDRNKMESLEIPVEQITRFRSFYENIIAITDPFLAYNNEGNNQLVNGSDEPEYKPTENISFNHLSLVFKVIFIVYFAGVLFFLSRFIFLLFWIKKQARMNKKYVFKNIHIVELNERMPTFSFFKTVFTFKQGLTNNEFNNILEHEKVHMAQWHSIDLVLLQVILIFQWFNPLIWFIQKAIKNTHEYLADSTVIAQGCALFDYQSMLLSQLISIRSVELVNNFNLLSIKKRIAMMNRKQSGIFAKLKAFFAIPTVVVVFFLFANYTTGKSLPTKNNSAQTIYESNIYEENVDVPTGIKSVREISDAEIRITIESGVVYINNKQINVADINTALSVRSMINEKDKTVLMEIDRNAQMKLVNKVHNALQQNNLLKVAYLVNKKGEKKEYGLHRLLPPLDKAIMLSIDELEKQGIPLIIFKPADLVPLKNLSEKLRQFILQNDTYVIKYQYGGETSYWEFIAGLEIVYHTIHVLRDEYASKQYGCMFNKLNNEEQKEVRNAYPITLTTELAE